MHNTHNAAARHLEELFDHAEALLLREMPAPIVRAVMDLARAGAVAHPDPGTQVRPRTRELADDREQLVTTREAAAQLRVSDKQIYRLVEQGRLRRHGAGHAHRFRASDITALLVEAGSSSGRRFVRNAIDVHGDSPNAA